MVDHSFQVRKSTLALICRGDPHLLLKVDIDVVSAERLEDFAEIIRREFRQQKIRFSNLDVENDEVRVRLRNADDAASATEIFNDLGEGLNVAADGTSYRFLHRTWHADFADSHARTVDGNHSSED